MHASSWYALLIPPIGLATALALARGNDGVAAQELVDQVLRERPTVQGAASSIQYVNSPASSSSALAIDPIAAAKRALARADEFHAIGDESRAAIAEATALEWAQTAREQLRAAVLDNEIADGEKRLASVATKAQRARTLLDEAIARRGQLQRSLDDLERRSAVRAVDGGVDARPKSRAGGKARAVGAPKASGP